MTPLEIFLKSYIEAALWSSMDDAGQSLDRQFSEEDLPTEVRARMEADCAAFLALQETRIREREHLAGHDFWLNRNGHGAGFFDGDWGEDSDALGQASQDFGECNLLLGDNGRLYIL